MEHVIEAKQGRWQSAAFLLLFLVADYVAIVAAEGAAFVVRNWIGAWWNQSYYLYNEIFIFAWVPLFFICSLLFSHTYAQMLPIVDVVRRIFYAIVYGLIGSILLLYIFKAGLLASRLFVFLFGGFVLLFVYAERYILLKVLKLGGYLYRPVLLIGAGKTAERVLRFFDGDLGYRYQIVGIIDDNPLSKQVAKDYPLLGGLAEAEEIVRRNKIDNVIITAPGLPKERLLSLIADIQPHVRNFSLVPDLIGTPMAGIEVSVLFSEEILLLHLRNNLARRSNRVFKRVFDLVCTVLGGLLISPLLLVIAICVAVDNRGSVIFAHRRVGRDGVPFDCYKFRTMRSGADKALRRYLKKNPEARKEWEENFKLADDPRVTRFGAFLRRTSLDELPQLWNVLKGEMSLVGPRPIVREEMERYGEFIREYLLVRPGITGMWQTSGRSDTTYEERVAMDTWYVRNWSVWIDFVYLFKTVKMVLSQKGAY